MQNTVSGFDRSMKSDATGSFAFSNVPFGSYHMAVAATGFSSDATDVSLRSAVPVNLKLQLALSGVATTVNVTAGAEDVVTNTPTAHTDLDSSALKQIPYQNTNAAVSSLITLATPGIAQDSDGIIHAQGEHQDVQFSVDGQPISDQQSRQFSNQIALSSIDSMNVISGVPPAEYGDKASLVVQTTTKSGLGEKLHGDVYGGVRFVRQRNRRRKPGHRFIAIRIVYQPGRCEQRTISRYAGVFPDARSRQRRERVRTPGLECESDEHDSPGPERFTLVGADAEPVRSASPGTGPAQRDQEL
jgi:hypothetical protein